MPSSKQRKVPDWRSEHNLICVFCGSARVPDPDNVIVVPVESTNDVAICELCITGAICAVAREYRRISARQKKPPQGPKGPPKKSGSKGSKPAA